MHRREGRSHSLLDPLAQLDKRRSIPAKIVKSLAHGARINKSEHHPSIGNIHKHRSKPRDINLEIQRQDKRRNILKLHSHALPILALRRRNNKPRSRIQPDSSAWLPHRHHPRLQQHSRDADRVGTRHGRILLALHDQKPRISCRVARHDDQICTLCFAPARFVEQELADLVVFCPKGEHLFVHCFRWDVEETAGYDVADFAFGMGADDVEKS
jgi:hypothetical protein